MIDSFRHLPTSAVTLLDSDSNVVWKQMKAGICINTSGGAIVTLVLIIGSGCKKHQLLI